MTPRGSQLKLCRGGYYALADEAGNRASSGLLALGRLAMAYRGAEHGAAWAAVYEALRWAETIHARLEPCDGACETCRTALEAERMVGGGQDDKG